VLRRVGADGGDTRLVTFFGPEGGGEPFMTFTYKRREQWPTKEE
jgi:hypothetical protein